MHIVRLLFGVAGFATGVLVFVLAWILAVPLSGWLQDVILDSELSDRVIGAINDLAG
jgi:hypothetical protein